jgi:hypothetical protein
VKSGKFFPVTKTKMPMTAATNPTAATKIATALPPPRLGEFDVTPKS